MKVFVDLQKGDKFYSFTEDKIEEFVVDSTYIETWRDSSNDRALDKQTYIIKLTNGSSFPIYNYNWFNEVTTSVHFGGRFNLTVTATSKEAILRYLEGHLQKEIENQKIAIENYRLSIKRSKAQISDLRKALKKSNKERRDD